MVPKGAAVKMRQLVGNRHISDGFTLLEVLITTIILAISLLGLASLQGVSKYSSYEARQRTYAMTTADDLIERLRLNKTAWINTYLGSSGSTKSILVGSGQTAQSLPACATAAGISSNCSDSNLVLADTYYWEQNLYPNSTIGTDSMIKNPQGCLTLSRIGSQTSVSVNLVISWQDRENISDAKTTTNQACGTTGNTHRQYVIKTAI
jgi:type IV pilus assembly protein PilV